MRRCLIALAALSVLTLPGMAAAKKLKMATLAPKGSGYHNIMMEMGQAWEAAAGGKFQFKLYPGGVAGADRDVVRKIRLGTMHGGFLTAGGVSSVDTAIHALALPMFYDSAKELNYVLEALRPDLDAAYAAKDFIALDYAFIGWVRFFTKEKGCSPDDLRSRKLFVFAGSPVEKLWKDAGFNPIPLPSTEISTALQTGLVTALPTPPQPAMLMQWQKHAPYMCDAIWAPLMGAVMLSKSAWDEFDAETQTKIRAATRAAAKKLNSEAEKNDAAAVTEMARRGLTVVPVEDALQAEWRKRTEETYAKVRGTYVSAELFDKAMAARAKFRALGAFTDGQPE